MSWPTEPGHDWDPRSQDIEAASRPAYTSRRTSSSSESATKARSSGSIARSVSSSAARSCLRAATRDRRGDFHQRLAGLARAAASRPGDVARGQRLQDEREVGGMEGPEPVVDLRQVLAVDEGLEEVPFVRGLLVGQLLQDPLPLEQVLDLAQALLQLLLRSCMHLAMIWRGAPGARRPLSGRLPPPRRRAFPPRAGRRRPPRSGPAPRRPHGSPGGPAAGPACAPSAGDHRPSGPPRPGSP